MLRAGVGANTEKAKERALGESSGAGGFLEIAGALTDAEKLLLVRALGQEEGWAADADWESWSHEGQLAPPGGWRTWVLMAGRGFGKTLAGAQWIRAAIATGERLEIALVGATIDEARRVMVDGRSGLLTVAAEEIADWSPTRRLLTFTSGARATLFSGASPDALRGPEHHLAWCDELAKWEKAQDTWDMLQLGLRLGGGVGSPWPRALVTTTPRSGAVLRGIMAEPDTVVTGGSTMANPHLSPAYKARMAAMYGGTRLGEQEVEGRLLTDAAGALWTVELLERCRLASPSPVQGEGGARARSAWEGEGLGLIEAPNPVRPELVEACPERLPQAGSRRGRPFFIAGREEEQERPSTSSGRTVLGGRDQLTTLRRPLFTKIVIGVDPPSADGTCGIIACAREEEGRAHVLADHSVTAVTPETWARAVADAVGAHAGLDPSRALVVAEVNQGGKMVEAVLHGADPALHVRRVTATVGKSHRAEPIASLFEAGKVVLHGRFPELEAQLLGMIAGGGYDGPGDSPDRADAMVWALTELMLRRRRAPQVRGFS